MAHHGEISGASLRTRTFQGAALFLGGGGEGAGRGGAKGFENFEKKCAEAGPQESAKSPVTPLEPERTIGCTEEHELWRGGFSHTWAPPSEVGMRFGAEMGEHCFPSQRMCHINRVAKQLLKSRGGPRRLAS